MKQIRICAVLTAHNRRRSTVATLGSYFAQKEGHDLRAVLVDDGSTDGTAEAVRTRFPRVTILKGNGSLYWNRGMAVALRYAWNGDDHFFLWLNDDTILRPGSLEALLETHRKVLGCGGPAIVVGSTCDPDSGRHTYGGVKRVSCWHAGKFRQVVPTLEIQQCDTMNGNIVLIAREIANLVGGIDERYSHSMGDYDYGLRARRLGIGVVIGPGIQGDCARNPPGERWEQGATFRKRLGKANSPKGLPLSEWSYFLRKHGNVSWPLAWAVSYRRLLFGARPLSASCQSLTDPLSGEDASL